MVKVLMPIFLILLLSACTEEASVSSTGVTQTTISCSNTQRYQTTTDSSNLAVYDISGDASYLDKAYDKSGFTGATSNKDIRYALVELVTANDQVDATTCTNSQGSYLFSNVPLKSTEQYRVRVNAGAQINSYKIAVKDHSSSRYSASKIIDVSTASQITQDITVTDESIAGIFNILDILSVGVEFVEANMTQGLAWKEINAYWESGSSRYGTYTCDLADASECINGMGMYVLAASSTSHDSDEYDDDVLLHEFGHVIEMGINMSDSPGGWHHYTDNKLDMRLTWSEGFAGFIQSAIKEWLSTANPQIVSSTAALSTQYVDTNGSSATEVDIVTTTGDPFVYASNEIAVSNVLWKTTQEDSISSVMAVFDGYMRDKYTNDTANVRINTELLWEGLLSETSPDATKLAAYEAIFADRKINYHADAYETSDSSQAYSSHICSTTSVNSSCFSENRNLYYDSRTESQDVDTIKVTLSSSKTYIIQTTNLLNGADTNITIYDNAGAGINAISGASNDDYIYFNTGSCMDYSNRSSACNLNNGTNMSSRVIFTPSYTGDYYISVTTTPDTEPALFAGKYGDYTLSVSVQ